MNKPACALTGLGGERVALCDVAVSATLQDLLSEVSVAQTYRNDEKVNIEAVYTFPLPLDAVLLELQVEIAGRVLKGVVVEKNEAEECYEDAIESGDAAVMLELIEPGLYTLNVGNLLPGERAKITFSYAQIYRWSADRLRFFLPTTIAPRYGDSPHAAHRSPQSLLSVENEFSLRVEVSGSLRDAQFDSPSHAVTLTRSKDKALISIAQVKVVMDRDFVLNVKAPLTARSFALCGVDGKGAAAVASFQPFFPGLRQPRPLNLAVLVDCSGSMAGDSIEQAKRAVAGILDGLVAHDCVNLIAFGGTTKALAEALLPCDKANLAKARRFAKALGANMGGTQIDTALEHTYATLGALEGADIFVITDGEVADWEPVVEAASRSGHRIFTVGVGHAVSEAFVRGLATETGGECELVSPHEGMAEQVVRHFERMRAPRAKRVSVHWPDGATDIAPSKIGAVFEGDTVLVSARFASGSVGGLVTLEVEMPTGELIRQELPISKALPTEAPDGLSTIARLAAFFRLKAPDARAGLTTALRYRLVSVWTNWLVIAERAYNEKAQEPPALRAVPQTLAAGWGGAGQELFSLIQSTRFSLSDSLIETQSMMIADIEPSRSIRMAPEDIEELPVARLITLIEEDPDRLDMVHASALLRDAMLDRKFYDLLTRADELGIRVEVFAAMALSELLSGALGKRLSGSARKYLAALQSDVNAISDALGKLAHFGEVMLHSINGAVREVLQAEGADRMGRELEKVARIRELLERLHERVKQIEMESKPLDMRLQRLLRREHII